MKIVFNLIILIIQIFISFVMLFSIYMLFALLDNDFGFDELFGLVIIQPILAIIFSVITIFVCLLFGLPIRLNSKINDWYRKHFYISIIGLFLGIIMLILAFIPSFKEFVNYEFDGKFILKEIPNLFCSISGWFLIAFSALHIYPPKMLTDRLQKVFRKK